ncbi:MAG: GntR family transcriptional regulator [Firmicutes bacterium]|nr:GntR family transcriptional regulator [Bacillota bacterium]
MPKFNKDSRLPLYHQLYDIILNEIETGELKESDKLPSERELCEKYDISRSTVRQAMGELQKNGYIYKQQGKGIFVSPKALKQDLLKFYSFTDEMKKNGKTPSSKVIDFQVVTCDSKLMNKLRCLPNSKLYKFTRLRLADEKPMMLETTYIPMGRFNNISKADLEKCPLYDILRNRFNVIFTKAEESFRPVNTRHDEAVMLEINEDVPSMMIERTTYENEEIIEYTVGIARGDMFEYRVVLEK